MASLAVGYPVSKSLASPITTFHGSMALFVCALFAADFVAGRIVGLTGVGAEILSVAGNEVILAVALLTLYCRYFGNLPRIAECLMLIVWAAVLSHAIAIGIVISGRSPSPLADSTFAGIDQAMGFSTAAVVQWIARYPLLRTILAISYSLVPVAMAAAMIIPVICRRTIDARRFIVGVIVAAMLTAAGFALLPAAGPWTAHQYKPGADQADVERSLHALKSTGPVAITAVSSAIVSFPSFHVVLAILPVIALWPMRRMRIPMVAFATLVCISTVTTGWHYGVDLIGGFAVAAVSAWIARQAAKVYAPPVAAGGAGAPEVCTAPISG